MTYTDHAAQARSYQSTAAAATRRAEADAARAADFYRTAARERGRAAWLAARPSLWDPATDWTPARREADARDWERIGDTYLRRSWNADASAVFYRRLAGQYRDMAARQAARMAAPQGQ